MTSIIIAADNFHLLQMINDKDRELLGVDSNGRLFQSPAIGVCKDKVQEVVRKTWQDLSQLPTIIRKLSELPIKDDIQQSEFFYKLFVEIHKSQDNSDDLFQRALAWSDSKMGSLTDGLSIAEAKKILDRQEPKHSIEKQASVETTANKSSCTEVTDKESSKVTIHVNTPRLEDVPLMLRKELPPADWAKYGDKSKINGGLPKAQLRDGSVVIGNVSQLGNLSLWSTEGKFIRNFKPVCLDGNGHPIGIFGLRVLENGLFTVSYISKFIRDILSPKGDLVFRGNTYPDLSPDLHKLNEGFAHICSRSGNIIVYDDSNIQLDLPILGNRISFKPLSTGGFALGEGQNWYFDKITIWQFYSRGSESNKNWGVVNILPSTPLTQWCEMTALPNGHLVVGSTRGHRHFWDPVTNIMSENFGAILPPDPVGSFTVLSDGQILERNSYEYPRHLWDANGILKADFGEVGLRAKVSALHITGNQHLIVTDCNGMRYLFHA